MSWHELDLISEQQLSQPLPERATQSAQLCAMFGPDFEQCMTTSELDLLQHMETFKLAVACPVSQLSDARDQLTNFVF